MNRVKEELLKNMDSNRIIMKAYESCLFISCMEFLTKKEEQAVRKRIEKFKKLTEHKREE